MLQVKKEKKTRKLNKKKKNNNKGYTKNEWITESKQSKLLFSLAT